MPDPVTILAGAIGTAVGSAAAVGARAVNDRYTNNKFVRKDLCELHVKTLSDLLKKVEKAVEKIDERVQELQRNAMLPTKQGD